MLSGQENAITLKRNKRKQMLCSTKLGMLFNVLESDRVAGRGRSPLGGPGSTEALSEAAVQLV